jgi:hypothetical protein
MSENDTLRVGVIAPADRVDSPVLLHVSILLWGCYHDFCDLGIELNALCRCLLISLGKLIFLDYKSFLASNLLLLFEDTSHAFIVSDINFTF